MPSKHKCPHTDRPIFSKGRCKQCAMLTYKPLKASGKPLARRTPIKQSNKPIRQVSKKRQAQLDEYSKKRDEFIKQHPTCRAGLKRCTEVADDVHHMKGKENDLLLDERYWLPICRSCHIIITAQSRMAIDTGLSVSRHKNE